MQKRIPFVTVALALFLAAPAVAQEAEAADEAAKAKHAEMMKTHEAMMAQDEGCECGCMKSMHEKMMKAHAEGHEGMEHAEGEGHEAMAHAAHAEGADRAEMKEEHKEMMAECKCMSGEESDQQAMSCKMHGADAMKGEMKETKEEAEADAGR